MVLYCRYCQESFDIKKGLLKCPHGQKDFHVLVPHFDTKQQLKIPENFTLNDHPFFKYRQFISSWCLLGNDQYLSLLKTVNNNLKKIGEPSFKTTPLLNNSDLEKKLNLRQGSLFIKEETGNVSGSHKSRHALGNLLYLEAIRTLSKGKKRNLAIYSCGNAALGAAAVAKALEYKLYTFVPENVDTDIEKRLVQYGARVVKVKRETLGKGDPCYLRFLEATNKLGFVPCSCSGPDNWPNIEGGATIIYEFIDQIKNQFKAYPDVLVVQVGGGALASSIIYGSRLLKEAGFINKLPRIFLVQTESCYPLYKTYKEVVKIKQKDKDLSINGLFQKVGKKGKFYMEAWSKNIPESLAEGILDDTTYDWLNCLEGVLESGGEVAVVEEHLIKKAYQTIKSLGMNISATGTSGLAGLLKLIEENKINKGDKIGLFFTGVDKRENTRFRLKHSESNVILLSQTDDILNIL